jgi:hypothetical protein
VLGLHRADGELTDPHSLAEADLEHALELPLPQEPAEPSRNDERDLLAELVERRQVQVVVVRV